MATNYIQDGNVLSLTAPATVTSGSVVVVGGIVGIALGDATSGAAVQVQTTGTWQVTKNTGEAWTAGQLIWCDETNTEATTVATSNKLLGVATVAAGSSDTTGVVNINGSASIIPPRMSYAKAIITDISTGASFWTVAPVSGKITKVYAQLMGAITNADAAVTLELGGTLVTDSEVTVATSGSAAGVVSSSTPSAANDVSEGDAIEVITDGGSTGTVQVDVTIIITE